MKKIFSLLALSMFVFTACSDDNSPAPDPQGSVEEALVDASDKGTWVYFSFKENKVVGNGQMNEASDQEWAARTDWDIALNRYTIRTNSGAATSVGAKGGVVICPQNITFEGLTELPANMEFKADKAVTSEGMDGTTTTVKSEATVILFKKNPDGSLIMPPVYLKAPIYVFRTADGQSKYKVEFTQYKDAEGKSGQVKFRHAQL